MHDVYINALGSFLPGNPISSNDMEKYLGFINGRPSRNRAVVLRQNRIKKRYYALDQTGRQIYSSAEMAANAIRNAVEQSEVILKDISYLATSCTLGDVLVPGLASHVHAHLGIKPIEIASFQSVCASALMAIKSAWLQIASAEHKCAAVSGSEFSSRYFRPGFYEDILGLKEQEIIPLEADFLRFTLSDGGGALIAENKPNEKQISLKIKWIDIKSFAGRFDTCMIAGHAEENFGLNLTVLFRQYNPAH